MASPPTKKKKKKTKLKKNKNKQINTCSKHWFRYIFDLILKFQVTHSTPQPLKKKKKKKGGG